MVRILFILFFVIASPSVLIRSDDLNSNSSIPADYSQLDPFSSGSLFDIPNDTLNALSPACKKDLINFLKDLKARKATAVQMVDAFGKIPSNIERGHLQWFGSYEECQAVPNKTANYCLVKLGSSDDLTAIQQSPALGTCFPTTCGKTDIESLINSLIALIKKNPLFPVPELSKFAARQTICTSEQPWETGAYLTIIILCLFVVFCAFGTIVECWHPRWARIQTMISSRIENVVEEGQGLVEAEVTELDVSVIPEMSSTSKAFVSFSFYSGWKYFTAERNDDLPYLNGIRVISICWVVMGEQFNLGEIIYENPLDFMDSTKSFLGQLIVSSSLAVDTFLTLSGLILTYTILKKLSRNDNKLNWIWVYVRRWWRLTPLYAMLLMIFLYLVPHIITGPFPMMIFQDTGGNPIDLCKKYWWTNLLYLNNFVPTETSQQCLDWTWFLAVEMQLFLITPILVFLLSRWSKVGVGMIVALVAGVLITNAVIEEHWGLPIALFQMPLKSNTTFDPNYDYVFSKPYTRASPYLLGMLLGFLFFKKPTWSFPYTKLDIVFSAGCWMCSCVIANLVVFGLSIEAYNSPTAVVMVGRVIWQMMSRFAFSVALCWVLFACQYGYAGPVRRILQWKVWRPLSHLTYTIYLFHPALLQLYLVNQRDPFYYNTINMVSIFLSQLFVNYLFAFFLAILIEIPLLRLEKEVIHF